MYLPVTLGIARGPVGGAWPNFDEVEACAAPELFVSPMNCVWGGFVDDRFLCAFISVRTSFIWSIKDEQTSSLSTLWALSRVKSLSPSLTRCAAFLSTRGKRKSRTCCEGSCSESTSSPSSKSCSWEVGAVVVFCETKLSSNRVWGLSLMLLEE
jgi:hypothetical protein